MRNCLLLITTMILFVAQPAAGIAFHQNQQAASPHAARTAIRPDGPKPPDRSNPDDAYRSASEGTLAFVASLFPILSLVALSATSFSFFIIPVFLFAIPAVIFGAIGLRRRKRGFAILGLSLGLLEIVAGIVALALL